MLFMYNAGLFLLLFTEKLIFIRTVMF